MEEWEIEEIEMRQKERHLNGECEGLPACGYCCDERDEKKEKDDAEGFYIGPIWVRR